MRTGASEVHGNQGPAEDADDRQQREQADQQVPLGHQRQGPERARRAVVERLEEVAPPGAVADAPRRRRANGAERTSGPPRRDGRRGCTCSGHFRSSSASALPYSDLLPEVAAHRARAGGAGRPRRAEADRPAPLLEPPADVDVVAGDPELRIEAADRLERLAPEGHVAARGCARRLRPRAGRGSGRPGDARRTLDKAGVVRRRGWGRRCRRGRWTEGVRRGSAASRGSGQASSSVKATISPVAASSPVFRAAESPRFSVRISRTSNSARDRRGAVGRAVVDDDHLVVGVVERDRAPRGSGRSSARRCTSRRRPRRVGRPCRAAKGTSANARSTAARAGFGAPVAVDEPEVPVVDVDAAAVPLVGPGEDERARAARRVRCAQLPLEQRAPGRRRRGCGCRGRPR